MTASEPSKSFIVTNPKPRDRSDCQAKKVDLSVSQDVLAQLFTSLLTRASYTMVTFSTGAILPNSSSRSLSVVRMLRPKTPTTLLGLAGGALDGLGGGPWARALISVMESAWSVVALTTPFLGVYQLTCVDRRLRFWAEARHRCEAEGSCFAWEEGCHRRVHPFDLGHRLPRRHRIFEEAGFESRTVLGRHQQEVLRDRRSSP